MMAEPQVEKRRCMEETTPPFPRRYKKNRIKTSCKEIEDLSVSAKVRED